MKADAVAEEKVAPAGPRVEQDGPAAIGDTIRGLYFSEDLAAALTGKVSIELTDKPISHEGRYFLDLERREGRVRATVRMMEKGLRGEDRRNTIFETPEAMSNYLDAEGVQRKIVEQFPGLRFDRDHRLRKAA